VIFEIGLSEMLPVVFEMLVGFPDIVDINSKILIVSVWLPVVTVDMYFPTLVFGIVNLRHLNVSTIRFPKEQNSSERIDIIECGISRTPTWNTIFFNLPASCR